MLVHKLPVRGEQVTLTPLEARVAFMVGKHRTDHANRMNLKERKWSPSESSLSINIRGAAGEFALAKMLGVYPKYCFVYGKVVNYVDVELPDGRKIDVKTSKHEHSSLEIATYNADKKKGLDFFVLMTGNVPTFTFKGAIKASEFLVDSRVHHRIRNTSYAHDVFLAQQEELKDFADVL